jgi:hypothetical protein
METNVPRVEALHTNHRWFTELQPPPNRTQPWIRVFRIEAGAFGNPIHGRLTVEELDATEPFDALSYCCGPPILSCTITVNGAPGFRITQNLWNALQRVRKKDGDRRLWVDAVCIDQEDEREKSSQVRHMHAVYSRAEEVCIYFGECTDQIRPRGEVRKVYECGGDVDRVPGNVYVDLDNESRNLQVLRFREPLRSARESASNWLMFRKGISLHPCLLVGCTPDLSCVDEFILALEETLVGNFGHDALRQYWWTRLWTVQELLLAKRPVVYCGPYVMLWAAVAQVWDIKWRSRLSFRSSGASRYQLPSKGSKMRNDIDYLEALRCQPEQNLHALLLATADKSFTEPKDRIFALLGVLPHDTISLDYSLDLRVIYTSTAIHCISAQGTFDIMFSQWERSFQLDSGAVRTRTHSCVPNFDRIYGTLGDIRQKQCLMRPEQGRWEGARVSTRPRPRLSNGVECKCRERTQNMAVLSGRDIDMEMIENTSSRCRVAFHGTFVTTVSKLYCLGQHNLDWILADLSRTTSRYSAEASCDGDRQREQRACEVYILLLESCSLHLESCSCSLDAYDDGEESDAHQQRQGKNSRFIDETIHCPMESLEFLAVADECLRRPWSECLAGPLASHRWDWTAGRYIHNQIGEIHELLRTLLSAVLERKSWSGTFFITADGHLGIGPESTQPGDQIVVLDGARSPFVLRALESSSDYALIGDSFVLGLVHGEVRDLYAWGELQSTKIVIQ